MADDDAYQAALSDYEEAVERLYQHKISDLAEGATPSLTVEAEPKEGVETALTASERLGDVAARNLDSSRSSERELASMQLAGAAALDFSVAADLANRSPEGVMALEQGSAFGSTFAELAPILHARPSTGIDPLAPRLVALQADTDPREALMARVPAAFDDVCTDAADAAQATFTRLLDVPGADLGRAAETVLRELLGEVADRLSWLMRRAVQFVLKGVEKLLRLIGAEAAKKAREQVAEWIKDLKEGDLAAALLRRLYGVDRLTAHLKERITAAPPDTDPRRFEEALADVNALVDTFDKQRRVMVHLARVLGWLRAPIMGIQPWGPIGYTAVLVTVLGYAIWMGGDYVDWAVDGGGRFDFVDGIPAVVDRELIA